jgi:hypothetical protein
MAAVEYLAFKAGFRLFWTIDKIEADITKSVIVNANGYATRHRVLSGDSGGVLYFVAEPKNAKGRTRYGRLMAQIEERTQKNA